MANAVHVYTGHDMHIAGKAVASDILMLTQMQGLQLWGTMSTCEFLCSGYPAL